MRSYVLRYAGFFEESGRACDTAISLDPTERRIRSCARAFLLSGRYEKAREFMRVDRGSEWVRHNMVSLLIREGEKQEALELLRGFEAGNDFYNHTLACLEGWPPHEHDRRIQEMEAAARLLSDSEQYYWAGAWLSYCGGPRPALGQLRRAVRNNYCATEILEADPLLASLRDHSEYASELQEIVAESKECQRRFLTEVGGV